MDDSAVPETIFLEHMLHHTIIRMCIDPEVSAPGHRPVHAERAGAMTIVGDCNPVHDPVPRRSCEAPVYNRVAGSTASPSS